MFLGFPDVIAYYDVNRLTFWWSAISENLSLQSVGSPVVRNLESVVASIQIYSISSRADLTFLGISKLVSPHDEQQIVARIQISNLPVSSLLRPVLLHLFGSSIFLHGTAPLCCFWAAAACAQLLDASQDGLGTGICCLAQHSSDVW